MRLQTYRLSPSLARGFLCKVAPFYTALTGAVIAYLEFGSPSDDLSHGLFALVVWTWVVGPIQWFWQPSRIEWHTGDLLVFKSPLRTVMIPVSRVQSVRARCGAIQLRSSVRNLSLSNQFEAFPQLLQRLQETNPRITRIGC